MEIKVKQLQKTLATAERKKNVSTVVFHATAGGTLTGAIATLQAKGISYHYIIDKLGIVWKCAPTTRVAFHAGKSTGPEGESVNAYSVGICFVNWNDGKDPYTDAQKETAANLMKCLMLQFHQLKYLTTHRQISWPRKNDPVNMGTWVQELATSFNLKYWKQNGVPES